MVSTGLQWFLVVCSGMKWSVVLNGAVQGFSYGKFAEPKTSDLINGSTVGFAKKTIGFDQRINGRLREKNHILINGSTVKKTIGFFFDDQRINGKQNYRF